MSITTMYNLEYMNTKLFSYNLTNFILRALSQKPRKK